MPFRKSREFSYCDKTGGGGKGNNVLLHSPPSFTKQMVRKSGYGHHCLIKLTCSFRKDAVATIDDFRSFNLSLVLALLHFFIFMFFFHFQKLNIH